MEILKQNFLNTTTQFVVNSNTATVGNIYLRDTKFQYASNALNDDNTTATVTINFDVTTTVDRIAMVEHNVKSFTIFYNGATANTLSLDAGQNTTTSDYSTNSDTSHYFMFTPVNVTSLTFDLKQTIIADSNKAIGYLVVSELRTDFDDRIPSAQNYTTVIQPRAVVHRLSDGGTRIQTLDEKRRTSFAFEHLTRSTRDTLKEIYDEHLEIVFSAFGTSTGWDAVIYPAVWEGDFNFYKFSDNASDSGFSGSLNLLETPL